MQKSLLVLIFILFLCNKNLYAQRTIKGKVIDDKNKTPLSGVSVSIKNTKLGAITNNDGDYSITVNSESSILVFKFIGYLSEEIPVNQRSIINVKMSEDSKQLEEVIVAALGIKREQKSLGYATQTIKGTDVTFTKDQNVIGNLAGKIAGAQVIGSSGANFGGTAKIKLRGINSLNSGGAPLMVVDGTPISQDNFSDTENGVDRGNISQDINPDDIENISILKGPAASAIYGLRGQYGAILITTKKGVKGTKNISVVINSAFSMEYIGNFIPLQNLYGVGNNQTFLTLANGQKYIDGNDESWGPKMDGTLVRMYYSFYPQDPMYGQLTPFLPYPDNIKNYYQTGLNANNGLIVTGGSENISYRFSFNNNYIRGTMPNTSLIRNNFGLNTSLNLNPKLVLNANVNYANNNAQRPTQGYQGSFTGAQQWFQRNLDINRLRNYKYPDGTILNWNVNPNPAGVITNNKPSDWNNPFFDAYEVLNNDSRSRVFGDVNFSYQLLPSLKLSGFIRSDFYTQGIINKTASGGRLDDGYAVGKYQNAENNYEFLGQYDKKWSDFSVNILLGANLFTQNYSQLYSATSGGLSSPENYTIAASINRPQSASYIRKKQIRSIYSTASFGYKEIYFVETSIRNDISSTLPPSNNSYWYPSVSGSFVFSELLRWSLLSFGKLRAGYAIAGADLSPYQTTLNYEVGQVYPTATSSINPLTIPNLLKNANIKPSFANSFELGVDFKFLNNRLGLVFTHYNQLELNKNVSLLGTSLRQQTSPVYLVTYAQSLFALAEAAKLGWITGDDATAKANYELAIQMSIVQWTGNTVGTTTYLSQNQVQYNPITAIKQIAYQRWVHLFLHGYEGWAEWRRTGYPILTAAPGANGDHIPRREGYPTQEQVNNTNNYKAVVASFPYGGIDDLNARVWWDKP